MWIGKDHAPNLRPPLTSFQKMQFSESRRRCSSYPPLVEADDRLCRDCERRYTWYVDQRLDDVWYNWPIIPGSYEDVQSCIRSYTRFHQIHYTHRDPTCFRAAIFCAILAFWCIEHGIVIDIRVGGRLSQDMLLYNKVHYLSCRKSRPLELMVITQFLEQGHDVLAMDMFPGSRSTAMRRFMDRQSAYETERKKMGIKMAKDEVEMLKLRRASIASEDRGSIPGGHQNLPMPLLKYGILGQRGAAPGQITMGETKKAAAGQSSSGATGQSSKGIVSQKGGNVAKTIALGTVVPESGSDAVRRSKITKPPTKKD